MRIKYIGSITLGVGLGVINLIIAFGYNKYYTKQLISEGYSPEYEEDKKLLDKYDIDY